MSTFEVKVRRVTQLTPHPNADRLELVVIGGYMAVVQKGIHQLGDLIVYIPEDSVFTDLSVAEELNIATYLTGKQKNRVKAVRLRGCLSQGIVLPVSLVEAFDFERNKLDDIPDYEEGGDVADILKIEKYEEPIPIQMMGKVRRWPSFLHKYDVENIKRPESMVALQPGEHVIATEKLHGTNITVAIGPGLEEDERIFVCSRNNALKEDYNNVYWRAVAKYELDRKLLEMAEYLDGEMDDVGGLQCLSIHGEVVGVQDLKYGYENGEVGFFAFDININGDFLSYRFFKELCERFDIPMVPVRFIGPYDYNHLSKLAEGVTHVIPSGHIMEGLVVRPENERMDPEAGRVLFKIVAEQYLLRKGGTELH